ncbi:hypothetical protein DFH11DRAFT_1542947 [Phellopilus nigrolimitatus]|nr:hypothetical protein DFH11DRAFT_1542947 [Phellopilus nigrolimitatus]
MASLAGRLRGRLRSRPFPSSAGFSPGEQPSVNRRGKKKQTLNAIPIALKELIMLLRESSDFCPPLKSVVGGIARIIGLVETMKGNKDDALRLFGRATSLLYLLADLITDSTRVPNPLFCALANLSKELEYSITKADRIPKKRVLTRLFNTSKDKEQQFVLRQQLDEAVERFKASLIDNTFIFAKQLAASVRTEVAVGEIKTAMCNQTNTISQAIMDSQISVSHSSKTSYLLLHNFFAFAYLYRGSA